MFKLSPSLALSNMERHHPESGQVQASSGHKRNNEPSPNHVTHEICINGKSLDAYVGCPINSDIITYFHQAHRPVIQRSQEIQ